MALTKKATLGLAILLMVVFQDVAGLSVDPVMTVIFAAITAVDLALLAVGAARTQPVAGWLREHWWPELR